MKKIKLLVLLTFIANFAWSQYSSFDHFFLNNYMINPAIAGIENYVDVQVGYRNQWTGIEGAPTTTYISWHQPISATGFVPGFNQTDYNKTSISRLPGTMRLHPHHGIGASMIMDNIGVFRSQEFSLSYAFHIPINKSLNASLGISPGLRLTSLNNELLSSHLNSDPAVSGFGNRIYSTLKLGGWIYSKQLYIGGAFHNSFGQSPTNQAQYYVNAGSRFVSNKWRFKPYTILRRTNNEWGYDVGMQSMWNKRLWFGTTYRSVSNLIYYAGVNITSLLSATFLYNDALKSSYAPAVSSKEIVVQLRLFGNREKVLCPQLMW